MATNNIPAVDNTGERILVEKETPLMVARHFFAYWFAEKYSDSKEVLDIACGEGYGSNYLAGKAKRVIGIDRDGSVIDNAKNKYIKDNLEFSCQDARSLNYESARFELICSFQTLEHIEDRDAFLSELRRLLKEGGTLVISTPNIKDASPHSLLPLNKFHVKEYNRREFEECLRPFFGEVRIYGLKRSLMLRFWIRLKKSGLMKWLPDFLNPVSIFFSNVTHRVFLLADRDIDNCLDFIAVCRG